MPLPFEETGLTEVAVCEPLGETLLSATALLLLERLPPATSSAFRFEGDVGFDVVPALILLERRPAVSSLSFVFDEEASVGVVVVVDFDLVMASESTGSGEKRSGTWRELRVKLRARREQHQHQQRQQPKPRGYDRNEIEAVFRTRQTLKTNTACAATWLHKKTCHVANP